MNRAIIILFLVTALIGIVSGITIGYGKNKFQAGIDHQKALQDAADDQAESVKVAELIEKNKAITIEKNKWKAKADKLSSLGPKVIYEEVTIEKIIEVETCTDRGDEFVRLWNDRYQRFLLGVDIISE